MGKDFKISIIMQSYLGDYPGARSNPEEKFIRAVNSVINQSYSSWELVIISDGCDATKALYEEHFKQEERIVFDMIDDHAGSTMQEKSSKVKYRIPGSPRARGVDIATGDWICYLDADDIFVKNAMEKLSLIIKKDLNTNKDLKFFINTARVEHSSWDPSNSKNLRTDNSPVKIDSLDSTWKTVWAEGGVITSASMIVHKKGFPSHSWANGGDYSVPRDTLFINGILSQKEYLNDLSLFRLPYYVRCHTRPGDVTESGWDY